MIAKKDLKHCIYYFGTCRNSHIAVWDEKQNRFYYMRYKFGGWMLEDIKHPEDDDGYDVFEPHFEVEIT